MKTETIWQRLSLVAGIGMVVASISGVAYEGTYAKEAVNWAAQGMGQDVVNILVAFPMLLACLWYMRNGSWRAQVVWLGLLIYMIYSYVLYAFFIHFGPLFPIYVATLGLSFYAFVGGLATMDKEAVGWRLASAQVRPASVFLAIIGVLFSVLWIGDVARALMSGGLPQGLDAIGLMVNPIQVLDLALLLPATVMISILLWKRRTLGYVLAVPLMTFFAIMGIAIIAMMAVLEQKGFPLPVAQMGMMGAIIVIDIALIRGLLKEGG